MSSKNLRAKLLSVRPDLRELDESATIDFGRAFDLPDEVDDSKLSLSAWKGKAEPVMANKNDVLSEEAIREMFSSRNLLVQQEQTARPAPAIGIIRAVKVKKSGFESDAEAEVKDFLVDEDEGLLGSQG